MTRYSSGVPGLLGGLLHESPEKVQESMQLFKEIAEAFGEASRRPGTTLQSIVHKCPLNTTPLQWCLKFGQACAWKQPTEQFKCFLRAMFMGFGQTKIVEEV